MDAQRHSAAYAATTSRRSGGNTTVIVLSILLAIALVALVALAWIHFSPMLFNAGASGTPGQVAPKHHW